MPTGPRRKPTELGGTDRGSSTLELVVVFPAVLLLIFGIVQGGLWYHARNIATYAAAEGLRETQARDGSAAAGQLRAVATLARTGAPGFLSHRAVAATRDGRVAAVTVSGRATALFPGLSIPIRQTATGPVERLTQDTP